MSEDHAADRLTRRRFIALSGAAGAGALLAGASAPENGWVQQPLPPGCGDVNDSDPLWGIAQRCVAKPNTCLYVANDYALVNGSRKNPTNHDYLLLPTVRRKGIECRLIWQPQEWNYWQSAWQHARSAPTEVKYAHIGLGVNSVKGRNYNQLHIHMAGIRPEVQAELKKVDGSITTDEKKWDSSRVKILGVNYRVLRRNNLDTNLFALTKDNVAPNDMDKQTIIVTPRDADGFYILNSQRGGTLDGTETCDKLLVYN